MYVYECDKQTNDSHMSKKKKNISVIIRCNEYDENKRLSFRERCTNEVDALLCVVQSRRNGFILSGMCEYMYKDMYTYVLCTYLKVIQTIIIMLR